jgi:hypothetical protein
MPIPVPMLMLMPMPTPTPMPTEKAYSFRLPQVEECKGERKEARDTFRLAIMQQATRPQEVEWV